MGELLAPNIVFSQFDRMSYSLINVFPLLVCIVLVDSGSSRRYRLTHKFRRFSSVVRMLFEMFHSASLHGAISTVALLCISSRIYMYI